MRPSGPTSPDGGRSDAVCAAEHLGLEGFAGEFPGWGSRCR